jgi:4-aminobutyrate aminotransferase/(S)-3-amino-2-methylpropionate transaminase
MSYQFVDIKTPIPGPKAKSLLERRRNNVPLGVAHVIPDFIESAKGALVKDVDGNVFIDFAAAIGTLNVGHNHPKIKQALQEQIDQYIHPGFNIMMYEPYIELAEKLCALAPGEHHKKMICLNSGAEAVENAVKIARKYTGRTGVISFSGGFHGRTLLTMSMTSKVKPYKHGFGPFAPEVHKAAFPDYYRLPEGMNIESYDEMLIQSFDKLLMTEVSPETVACIVMEPVQGEGGFVVPTQRFVQGIYNLCKQHGILFIADEIQTAFSRTGRYFASEHYDIVPDLITVSKSLAAGLPISGVIGRAEVMDAAQPGELGGTYAGSPLGCRAALAVLEIIHEEKLNQRAEEIGQKVMDKFNHWKEQFSFIGDVRGLGAMCALEIVKDRRSKEPNKALTARIISEVNRQGVLIIGAGIYSNVIRLLMPLVITDEQLDEGLGIIEMVMKKEENQDYD